MSQLFEFDPRRYGTKFASVFDENRLPALGPGVPESSVRDRLSQLTLEELFHGYEINHSSFAKCCLSGLWLWFDFLDESHAISQSIDTVEGSYWHGIMHRREPDYGNAKYWYRRVGTHTIMADLEQVAHAILDEHDIDAHDWFGADVKWNPFRFIDLCEQYEGQGNTGEQACREIARAEWHLLFDHCYQEAL